MLSTQKQGLKKENHSANRFNDSEYERWSAGITARRPSKAIEGITRFLATAENSALEHEDLSASMIEFR